MQVMNNSVVQNCNLKDMDYEMKQRMNVVLHAWLDWRNVCDTKYNNANKSYKYVHLHVDASRKRRKDLLSDSNDQCQLTHWGRDKITAISQMTFLNAFFLNENVWISLKISLKYVLKFPIGNNPALF